MNEIVANRAHLEREKSIRVVFNLVFVHFDVGDLALEGTVVVSLWYS
jgi:hypothetical protein